MKKKVICLITNWYPTPENPFQGSFFKEQALSLSDYFDFIVVHYYFSYGIIREKYCVTECGEEDNIKEYRIELTVPTLIGEVKNKLFFPQPVGIILFLYNFSPIVFCFLVTP